MYPRSWIEVWARFDTKMGYGIDKEDRREEKEEEEEEDDLGNRIGI